MADDPEKNEPEKPDLLDKLSGKESSTDPRPPTARTLREILADSPEGTRAALRRAALRKAMADKIQTGRGQPTKEQLAEYEAAIRRLAEEQVEAEQKREQELLDAAVKWLENKWGELPCPYCRHVEWQVGTPLSITVGPEEAMSPAFPVMCGNCGHTTFVNAIRAGLLPEPDEE